MTEEEMSEWNWFSSVPFKFLDHDWKAQSLARFWDFSNWGWQWIGPGDIPLTVASCWACCIYWFEEQLAEHLLLAGRNRAAGCFVVVALYSCHHGTLFSQQYCNSIDFDLPLISYVHYWTSRSPSSLSTTKVAWQTFQDGVERGQHRLWSHSIPGLTQYQFTSPGASRA